jgi:uncharacterized membrane protein YgcG
MNNIYDVLEICLQELENGADLKTVLASYPDLASELRPILKASIQARMRSVDLPAPSSEVVRRGRAKLLKRASEMREAKVSPRKRMIPLFQRLALSFSLTAVFLASGTGLVGASSTALPGEHLYPVKRTWEDVRLFFTFNPDRKGLLESEFETERLDEVDELLIEGRHEVIQYSGVFKQVNSVMYVSGVKVLVPANLQVPADGAAVTITGRTNAQTFVEIESIELLPDGAFVPVGKPIEADEVSESGSDSSSEEAAGSESGNGSQGSSASESPKAEPKSFEMKGTVESISNNILIVNGQTVYLDNARIDGVLTPGANVEIKGYYASDGSFIVTEVQVKKSESGDSNEKPGSDGVSKSSSDSDSNSSENSGSDSGDDSNSNDNSGDSGGGGDSGDSGKD